MPNPKLLGQLASIHQLISGLLEATAESDCNKRYHPELATLSWYLGYAVFLETYWLEEIISSDDNLSRRVRPFFATGKITDEYKNLPPVEHLLNWALEIQDKHLTKLANNQFSDGHPMMQDDRLLSFIIQEQAKIYDLMLLLLAQRQMQKQHGFEPSTILQAAAFNTPLKKIKIGHYKIGGKDNTLSYDNELPIQMVELHSFKISELTITNAQYLQFMQDGNYQNSQFWSDDGKNWLSNNAKPHPEYWKQSETGNWYEIGSNGPTDIIANSPVVGINYFEAEAWCNWLANTNSNFEGAALQHEYQWETALRNQFLSETGRCLEWCHNDFFAYDLFKPYPDNMDRNQQFNQQQKVMRGATIHSQPILRRPSIRYAAQPRQKIYLTGIRPVFPSARD